MTDTSPLPPADAFPATPPLLAPAPAPQQAPISEWAWDDQRIWATFTHLAGFLGGWPVALFVYLTVRHRGMHVRYHAAAELNIAITYGIGLAISALLSVIPIVNIIAWVVMIVFGVLRFAFAIVASMKAYRGEPYKVPGAFPFVS